MTRRHATKLHAQAEDVMEGDSGRSGVVYTEGDHPDPVTPENPLVGLETLVLKVWLENSRVLRKAYRLVPNRTVIENAAREAVFNAIVSEMRYQAQGLTFEQAQELTRPAMWTAPIWPTFTASSTERSGQ